MNGFIVGIVHGDDHPMRRTDVVRDEDFQMTDRYGSLNQPLRRFDGDATRRFIGGQNANGGLVYVPEVNAVSVGQICAYGPMFDVLNRANGGGLYGQCVSKPGVFGSIPSDFDSVFNPVGEPCGRIPVGVVFKIRKIGIQKNPHSTHDGDDHGQEHDDPQHLAHRSLVIAPAMRCKLNGVAVHKVDTTPYHLAIDLELA